MGLSSLKPHRHSSAAVKWLGFVTAVWVQSISGNNYTFSNYSAALKSLMNLTQLQLNSLSVAKDLGKAFGLLAGVASDRVPTPLILLIGAVEGLVGYGAQWLVVSQRIKPLPFWQMCVFLCLGGNSTTWMNTAVLVTCIRNFRRNRGPVSGILKGYVGLSTAIFTALCPKDAATFVLSLAVVPLAVCLAAVAFLRETDGGGEENEELRFFGVFNAVAISVAVYLLIRDFFPGGGAAFSAVLLVLLASPLAVPLYAFLKSLKSEQPVNDPDSVQGTDPETRIHDPLLDQKLDLPVAEEVIERPPVIGEDHTIMEAVATVDFWILFVSFLCGVGTGLAVMNNMGQMGVALGYSDVSIFVSLTSIFGFFGRIGSGMGSEYLIKKASMPRPLLNAASQVLMALGYILMAMAVPGSLYIGSIVVGICYGVRLAVTVPTASELFGLKYYGLIYNILILNLPLGSFLFSGLLAGLLYDAEATAAPGGGNTCVGAHCFRLVFVVMAFACVVGFGLDLLLSIRTKSLYAKIHASKRLK